MGAITKQVWVYYFVGLEVLVMLGYVQRTKSVILPRNKEEDAFIGSKLSVSERAVDDIKNNYIIYLLTWVLVS
jgi:hypothetical protein